MSLDVSNRNSCGGKVLFMRGLELTLLIQALTPRILQIDVYI